MVHPHIAHAQVVASVTGSDLTTIYNIQSGSSACIACNSGFETLFRSAFCSQVRAGVHRGAAACCPLGRMYYIHYISQLRG